jgi:hypothetical protein
MLSDEYGVTAPTGMSQPDLKDLYCKAAEAADYGIIPVKNDTTSKLQRKIEEEQSKGRRRGDPIPYPQNPANPITAPVIPGGGQIYVKDRCGASPVEMVPVYPIGSSPGGWGGRTLEEVMVRYTDIPNLSGLDTSDPPHAWGGIGGVTPASSNGFYIENGNLWTTSDDGEPIFLGGNGGEESNTTGWVTGYKVIRAIDENGNESGTYDLEDGEWGYTPPAP